MKALLLFLLILPVLRADDVLFIGNSFTFVNDVPKLVETIAASKGKTLQTEKVTKGGVGWAYHLAQPATDIALKSKAWNWIVLQDYSLDATHVKGADEFMKNGQAFYDRIAQETPAANILLYETWAYSPRHPELAGTPAVPPKFTSPEEMYSEIHKNYAALQVLLQAKDPKRQVLVAPIGTAFARCIHEHPELNLYAPDFKHPDIEGSYLAALVIYATIFHDTPEGAAANARIDPAQAGILQDVAAEVTRKK